jgi:hypothetical protein
MLRGFLSPRRAALARIEPSHSRLSPRCNAFNRRT